MTLKSFLSSLKSENVKAVISMGELKICTIYAYGVDALDEIYKNSEVISWEIAERSTIHVVIEGNPSA